MFFHLNRRKSMRDLLEYAVIFLRVRWKQKKQRGQRGQKALFALFALFAFFASLANSSNTAHSQTPKDQRPARPELAWGGVETNRIEDNNLG
jgi:hypothetical protein